MITKEGRDLPIEQVTAENYVVPAGEEMCYHCKIEVRQFNPKTGKRISTPRVQKFGAKVYKAVVADSLRKQGYEIEVLHNPETWLREHQAKAEETRAKAKAAEKEALKAEILEELRASGVIPSADDAEKRKPGRPAKAQE